MAHNNQQEVTFDIPYYANTDECRSDFFVNVTWTLEGQHDYHVIDDIVQVSTTLEDVTAEESHWQACQPFPFDIVDDVIRQRHRCNCVEQCTARVTVTLTKVPREQVDMCDIKLYW